MIATNTRESFTPIFFDDFARFRSIFPNVRKAEFLCRLYFYCSISKYKMDDERCFTRTTETLAKESGISVSSASVYLKEFEQQGLIKRCCKLFKKKRLYIFMTKKLLLVLGLMRKISHFFAQKNDTVMPESGISIYKDKDSNKRHSLSITGITSNSDNADISKNSIAKNKDFDLINDLELSKPSMEELADSYAEYEQQSQTQEKIQSKQCNHSQAPKHSVRSPKNGVEQQITKTLTKTQKKYVKTVTSNLEAQIEITKPEKLKKEIEEALINPKRFSKSKSFMHKVNAIAKTIRSGNWHAPIDAVNDNTGSHDAFKVVHVSRDEDGHNLIEVEQSNNMSFDSDDDWSEEEEAEWNQLETDLAADIKDMRTL